MPGFLSQAYNVTLSSTFSKLSMLMIIPVVVLKFTLKYTVLTGTGSFLQPFTPLYFTTNKINCIYAVTTTLIYFVMGLLLCKYL